MTGVLLALLLSADGGTAAPIGPAARATVVFAGDIIPHTPLKDAIRTEARKDKDKMGELWALALAPLTPQFTKADLTVANLETPIVELKKPFSGQWIFYSGPDLLDGLKRSGIKAVSFANNHSRDQQLEGITQTRKFLDAAGLKSLGAASDEAAAWEPLIIEVNGIRIGFFAFTRFLNHFKNKKNTPHVPFVPYSGEPRDGGATVKELLEKVKAMRARCDALVVLPHWGNEYMVSPKDSDQALAEQLLSAGVTAVVGSHPHVVQPIIWRRMGEKDDRLVAFSLGNLLSNQEPDDWSNESRFGLVLELVFEHVNGAVRLTSATPTPIWTDNNPAPNGRKVEVMAVKEAIDRYRQQAAAPDTKPHKVKFFTNRADRLGRILVRLEKMTRTEVVRP
jgi:poly-gamma-glutamate capsule biosynthesis protein CapA/YwtB (metallophosphatase superfamily)